MRSSQPGDAVKVKILEIDSERRRLSLSVKRVEGQILSAHTGYEPEPATGDLDDVRDLELSDDAFSASAPAMEPADAEVAVEPEAAAEVVEPEAAAAVEAAARSRSPRRPVSPRRRLRSWSPRRPVSRRGGGRRRTGRG